MNEFKKNTIATDEDYFKLSDHVYDDYYLQKGTEIKGRDKERWVVIESIDADCEKVKNGLQAIAVVPKKDYKENKTHYENIVIAFRGTEFGKWDGDLSADTFQVTLGIKKNFGAINGEFQYLPTSFERALEWTKKDIVDKYQPTSLHTTGHSKGGAEADLVAAELDCYATTYAAPNPYRILSPQAKRRVDEGKMENKATDYTHKNDPIGNHTQFGAPLIGKQYTVRQNDTKEGFFTRLTMEGHGRDTFRGSFHSGGSVRLQLEPDEIIKEAQGLQTISHTLLRIAKNIEEFQRKEEEAIAQLKRQLKRETGPGGKHHLLSEHDVDEAIAEIAKARRGGQVYFYDVDLAEELIHLLQKEQKNLDNFGERIARAAKSFRDQDGQLAEENFNLLGSR